jgi:hypothetical protein
MPLRADGASSTRDSLAPHRASLTSDWRRHSEDRQYRITAPPVLQAGH